METKKSKYWDTPRAELIRIIETYDKVIKETPNDAELGKKIRKII